MSIAIQILSLTQRLNTHDARISGGRSYATTSDSKSNTYITYEKDYQAQHGQVLILPSEVSKLLSSAEVLLEKYETAAMNVCRYPYHTALQVLLKNCIMISFVFNSFGDIHRVYIDDSLEKYVIRRCETANISANGVLLAMEGGELVGIINSQREKAKRMYVNPKQSIHKHIRLINETSIKLQCINEHNMLLALSGEEVIIIYDIQHQTIELPPKHLTLGGSQMYSLRQDMQYMMEHRCEYVTGTSVIRYMEFDNNLNNNLNIDKLLIVSQEQANSQLIPVIRIRRLNIIGKEIVEEEEEKECYIDLRNGNNDNDNNDDNNDDNNNDDNNFKYLNNNIIENHMSVLDTNCIARNNQQNRMILATNTNEIIILSLTKNNNNNIHVIKNIIIHSTNSIPSLVLWHPSDDFFLIAYKNGDLRLFDSSLQPLQFMLSTGVSTEILSTTTYMSRTGYITQGRWIPNESSEYVAKTTNKSAVKAIKNKIKTLHNNTTTVCLLSSNNCLISISFDVGIFAFELGSTHILSNLRLNKNMLCQVVEYMILLDDINIKNQILSQICIYIYQLSMKEQIIENIHILSVIPSILHYHGDVKSAIYKQYEKNEELMVSPLSILCFLLTQIWTSKDEKPTNLLDMTVLLIQRLLLHARLQDAFMLSRHTKNIQLLRMCHQYGVNYGYTDLSIMLEKFIDKLTQRQNI